MPIRHLLPVENIQTGFTTCTELKHDKLTLAKLDDKELNVHRVSSGTTHNIVEPPKLPARCPCCGAESDAPNEAWEVLYPEGSINPAGAIPGGFGFYLTGPKEFTKALGDATEVVFSYRMMLQEGWEFVKGGKLPGVYGGVGSLAYGCAGGRQKNRCQCFDLRPMWRSKAVGELYTYIPLSEHNKSVLLAVPPTSIANSDFGYSVGRDSYKFDCAVGKWIAVAFRVKLNDIGKTNGEIELWVYGTSTMCIKELSLRESEESKIKGMHFQTFFGGHLEEWASPKDQRAWFADVTGAVIV